mgnify:CR=1 FL=1
MTLDTDEPHRATCQACQAQVDVHHTVEYPLPDSVDATIPHINPTDEPSRLVDLNQWLGLHYFHAEAAQACKPATAEHHTHQLWAAACIAEALKFYTDDDELPIDGACWTESSLRALAEHQEVFARQRLVDLRTKLPPLPAWPE